MAHVMNYSEICEAAKNNKIIYEENHTLGLVRPMRFDGVDFVGVNHHHYLLLLECDEEDCPDYNLFYRCWDEEPTEEQMKNTPWKENPYKFD